MMKLLALALSFVITQLTFYPLLGFVPIHQNSSNEIAELLNQLSPGVIGQKDDGTFIIGPTLATVQDVRTQILRIANESPESRNGVIVALTIILNEPKPASDILRVNQWLVAVGLLGELRATEAIADLVKHLDQTGHDSPPPRHPPVRTALSQIGPPAIPSLLIALSDSSGMIQSEASEALAEIGEPAVDGLAHALSDGTASVRASAANALSKIGSKRCREAIENVLRIEADKAVRTTLTRALNYMDHVDCLKDSSRCK